MKYYWKNLAIGGSGVSEFNATHHSMFAPENIKYFAPATLLREATYLMWKWNSQQPKTWRYSLTIEEDYEN